MIIFKTILEAEAHDVFVADCLNKESQARIKKLDIKEFDLALVKTTIGTPALKPSFWKEPMAGISLQIHLLLLPGHLIPISSLIPKKLPILSI